MSLVSSVRTVTWFVALTPSWGLVWQRFRDGVWVRRNVKIGPLVVSWSVAVEPRT